MRKKIVGSSWKMHITSFEKARELANDIVKQTHDIVGVDLFILPPYLLLNDLKQIFENSKIKVGVQNVAHVESGAMTGEVPMNLVKESGSTYVEIGHAERRAQLAETNEKVFQKVALCEKYQMIPVICIGETQQDIDQKMDMEVLKTQILWALSGLSESYRHQAILAYEPVWAIGQAQSASKEYIQTTHQKLRAMVAELFGEQVAAEIRIIYGGSVNDQTAYELSHCEDVDGLFVGRFGLSGEGFSKIVKNFKGE